MSDKDFNEDTIIDYEDPDPDKTLGDLQKKRKKIARDKSRNV